MRFFKLAVFSLIAIFLLFTGIGLMMPSSVTVTRTKNINAPIDSVGFYTNNLINWHYWLNGVDTNYKAPTNNATLKLGAYIISVTEKKPNAVTTLWQSESAKDQLCRIHLNYSSPNETIVYFSFQQHISWLPWDRMGGMLHDEVIGPSMQSSLDKLKEVVEKTQD